MGDIYNNRSVDRWAFVGPRSDLTMVINALICKAYEDHVFLCARDISVPYVVGLMPPEVKDSLLHPVVQVRSRISFCGMNIPEHRLAAHFKLTGNFIILGFKVSL